MPFLARPGAADHRPLNSVGRRRSPRNACFATLLRMVTLTSLTTWFLSLLPLTHAQIYPFENAAVPSARSLHVLQAFYVFSEQDAPAKIRPQSKAFVIFHELRRTESKPVSIVPDCAAPLSAQHPALFPTYRKVGQVRYQLATGY